MKVFLLTLACFLSIHSSDLFYPVSGAATDSHKDLNSITHASPTILTSRSTSLDSSSASGMGTVDPTFHSSSSSPASTFVSTTVNVSPTSLPETTSTSTTPAQRPTQTIDSDTLRDIITIHERRLSSIIGGLTQDPIQITAWLSTLGSNGKWPDGEVDYATGCDARRANWPAQEHWQRIVLMASAWHGGLEGAEQFVKDGALRDSISLAMDYWFSRDFTNPACLDSGGTSRCPCSNADNSLWNTNWFSNIILIPELVGQTCLLLNDTLIPAQLSHCTIITGRSYGTFDQNINGVGFLTGANTLDVAKVGIDQAILTVNVSMLIDAYRRVHLELTIKDEVKADGIRPDGSFGQHGGMLYNGNYGKDYTNDILDIEIEAGGTQFSANSDSQTAFATLFDGDLWMIYRNALTDVLHWDFSALGRFISFPVADNQATGNIKINLTEVDVLGRQWSSPPLTNFANTLTRSTGNANAGGLEGNRMFFNTDYMVHRGRNYVSTVKMFSTRTQNTECVNSQNPMGFHLSDGTTYTYIQGNEYEDISAAWDWDMIPGITVDYGATPLSCSKTQFTGVERFVGGASDGQVGLAAMRYTNPLTKSLHWQKAWFFLADDVQHVMIANISSTTNVPVYTVLDQRRHAGTILVDGVERSTSGHSNFKSLWHGGVGYTFSDPSDAFSLSLEVGQKTGNWSAIGTSTQPPPTIDLFTAWIQHNSLDSAVSYSVFPGTSSRTFVQKSHRLQLQYIRNDAHASAIFHEDDETFMAVFWDAAGGSVDFLPSPKTARITITVNGNAGMIYRLRTGEITVSDPSQSLVEMIVTLKLGPGRKPPHWGKGHSKRLIYALPDGGLAGSGITQLIQAQ